jgi:hypothetical protein
MAPGENIPPERRRGDSSLPDDPALAELRSRLDALQSSVERLGADEEPPPGPAGGHPSAADSHGTPYPPAAPSPPPAGGVHEPRPAEAYFAPAPPPPPAGYDPYAPPGSPQHRPPPVASNGRDERGEAVLVPPTISILDVGPFRDLIDLRHFEDAVTGLETVRDARVRRVGHGRAEIEVAMAGPYPVTRELQRLGRPLRTELGPGGEIVVEFTDQTPEEAEAGPQSESPAADRRDEGSPPGEQEDEA